MPSMLLRVYLRVVYMPPYLPPGYHGGYIASLPYLPGTMVGIQPPYHATPVHPWVYPHATVRSRTVSAVQGVVQ